MSAARTDTTAGRPGEHPKGFRPLQTCTRVAKAAVQAEPAFLSRLAELGATPLYEKWLGVRRKHHVLCADGHDCYPEAQNVLNGTGSAGPVRATTPPPQRRRSGPGWWS